ncbi:PASTA domain-containing protein [Streptomyces scabiei]|uniref:PASTA domain-containing protein n=1 Tax=Streptomyces scabiei TaxID=1930 RepID=UPI0029B9DB5E|nr:PASTA domain-containing protein [Streptomyces scabiei]MDX2566072.1 PASTA domain-containing protein [Streptomyces scabiei]MDX3149648.1 PASTA domain-containing protein [Streptomyces scabiei]MDX3162160.1 PASTA domain-containing protein [Streptomyces scabiei]MDX3288112.1 PASTA domain-containing protein [Streptomyces scabiei]
MRTRTIAATLAAATLLMLTACEGTDTGPSKPDTTAQETSDQPKTDASATEPETDAPATEASATEAEPETSEVPDVVGMNHGEAQSLLRSMGFLVNEEDASSEGRWVLDNSNWKVCRQDPAPGATDALRVAIYSVKLDESC